MLLANLTLRHHSIWDDDCHKMASLLKDETFQTYNNWCDKMGVAGDRRFLKIARASQLQATRKNWDAGPEHGGLSEDLMRELSGTGGLLHSLTNHDRVPTPATCSGGTGGKANL